MAEAAEAKALTGAADMDKYQTQASETGEAQEEPGMQRGQASFEPPLDGDDGWGTAQDYSPESSDGEWTEEEGSEVDEADLETPDSAGVDAVDAELACQRRGWRAPCTGRKPVGGRLPTVRMAEPDDRFIGNVLSLKGVQDQLARSAAAEKEKCTT
jgi:hypothetical protein